MDARELHNVSWEFITRSLPMMPFNPEAADRLSYFVGLAHDSGLSGVREIEPPASAPWSAFGGAGLEGLTRVYCTHSLRGW